MRLASPSYFAGMLLKPKEKNISTKCNGLKNPNWRVADQLAIYTYDRGVELRCIEKQLQLSGQRETRLNPRPQK